VTGSPASFGEARLWGAGCPKQALRLRHPLGVGHRRHRSSAAPLGSSNRRSPLGGQCCWLNPHRPVSTRLGEKSLQPVAAHRPGFRASTGVSARKACVYGTEAQRFESSRARSKKFRLRRGIRAGAERPVVAAEPRRAPAVRRLADEPARTQRTSERPLGRERADAGCAPHSTPPWPRISSSRMRARLRVQGAALHTRGACPPAQRDTAEMAAAVRPAGRNRVADLGGARPAGATSCTTRARRGCESAAR
jgi:hypothetical protein